MITQMPPRWLESILLWCLPARDREAISGDLLEEYREEQVPHRGRVRANVWYLRQLLGFLSVRSVGGPPVKTALTCMSLFTAAAGVWLAVMENILKHSGYGARTAVAACIAVQGLATVLWVVRDGGAVFRALILVGAAGVLFLGASAVKGIAVAPHFEAFVLLTGAALIAEGLLAFAAVMQAPHRKTI